MADWLLKRGAAVNHEDSAGVTPIMVAPQSGSAQLLSILLEHGADLHACSADGCNALHFASCSGEPSRPSPPQSAALEQVKIISQPCSERSGCQGTSERVVTTTAELLRLRFKAWRRLTCCLVFFLPCGLRCLLGLTGSEEVLDLLMEKGSDMEVVCQRGATVLHHAAEANRPDLLARLLRRAGESLVRVQDSLGWTALHYAAMHEHCDCAGLLTQVCRCSPARGPPPAVSGLPCCRHARLNPHCAAKLYRVHPKRQQPMGCLGDVKLQCRYGRCNLLQVS